MSGFDRRKASPRVAAAPAPRLCHCSFCGRSQHECFWMLAGPHPVFICDQCVDEAATQIAKIRAEQAPPPNLGVDR
jgi:hypothetical protein